MIIKKYEAQGLVRLETFVMVDGKRVDLVFTPGVMYYNKWASITVSDKAVQDALKIENEVKAVEANAKKAVAEAEGRAKALKIQGDAEAEYNRKIAASLSTLIIQQEMVDKWDGKLPQYATTPTLFKDLGR
jgi:regulator of protease activity HflC (stomatin/prohibitin superfamily)